MMRKMPGETASSVNLQSIDAQVVKVPQTGSLTHLQFRRFAGCPICNLHIHSFIARSAEILAAGVQEVVVFHSSEQALKMHKVQAPFAVVADPDKRLYRAFGLESSLRSVLHPGAWRAALHGLFKYGFRLPERGEHPLGMPADFLIDGAGKILAVKYGQHADDQWTVDEVLALVRELQNQKGVP